MCDIKLSSKVKTFSYNLTYFNICFYRFKHFFSILNKSNRSVPTAPKIALIVLKMGGTWIAYVNKSIKSIPILKLSLFSNSKL